MLIGLHWGEDIEVALFNVFIFKELYLSVCLHSLVGWGEYLASGIRIRNVSEQYGGELRNPKRRTDCFRISPSRLI
jgi:hypothetical protein